MSPTQHLLNHALGTTVGPTDWVKLVSTRILKAKVSFCDWIVNFVRVVHSLPCCSRPHLCPHLTYSLVFLFSVDLSVCSTDPEPLEIGSFVTFLSIRPVVGFPFHSWCWWSFVSLFYQFCCLFHEPAFGCVNFLLFVFCFIGFCFYFLPPTYFKLVLCFSISNILKSNHRSLIRPYFPIQVFKATRFPLSISCILHSLNYIFIFIQFEILSGFPCDFSVEPCIISFLDFFFTRYLIILIFN